MLNLIKSISPVARSVFYFKGFSFPETKNLLDWMLKFLNVHFSSLHLLSFQPNLPFLKLKYFQGGILCHHIDGIENMDWSPNTWVHILDFPHLLTVTPWSDYLRFVPWILPCEVVNDSIYCVRFFGGSWEIIRVVVLEQRLPCSEHSTNTSLLIMAGIILVFLSSQKGVLKEAVIIELLIVHTFPEAPEGQMSV